METRKELISKLNDFKGKCNRERVLIDNFNNQVEKNTRIILPNIINIYRDKVLELNDLFKEKGLEYFSKDCYLRVLTKIYFNIINCRLYSDLIDLTMKIRQYNFYSIFSGNLADKFYDRKVQVIKDDIKYIQDFDVLEYPELLQLIFNSDNLLLDLLPDCYSIFIEEIFKELDQLDIDYSNIDMDKLIICINNREEKSKKLFEENNSKRIELFDKFKEEYDINITSDYQIYSNYKLKK